MHSEEFESLYRSSGRGRRTRRGVNSGEESTISGNEEGFLDNRESIQEEYPS